MLPLFPPYQESAFHNVMSIRDINVLQEIASEGLSFAKKHMRDKKTKSLDFEIHFNGTK